MSEEILRPSGQSDVMSEANKVIIYGAAEANINYKTEFVPKGPCFGGKGQEN